MSLPHSEERAAFVRLREDDQARALKAWESNGFSVGDVTCPSCQQIADAFCSWPEASYTKSDLAIVCRACDEVWTMPGSALRSKLEALGIKEPKVRRVRVSRENLRTDISPPGAPVSHHR